jgi:hypothetical protein
MKVMMPHYTAWASIHQVRQKKMTSITDVNHSRLIEAQVTYFISMKPSLEDAVTFNNYKGTLERKYEKIIMKRKLKEKISIKRTARVPRIFCCHPVLLEDA